MAVHHGVASESVILVALIGAHIVAYLPYQWDDVAPLLLHSVALYGGVRVVLWALGAIWRRAPPLVWSTLGMTVTVAAFVVVFGLRPSPARAVPWIEQWGGPVSVALYKTSLPQVRATVYTATAYAALMFVAYFTLRTVSAVLRLLLKAVLRLCRRCLSSCRRRAK